METLIEKLTKYLKHPSKVFFYLSMKGLLDWMDDELYLRIAYRIKIGKKLNLRNPVTFNEKLQWLKINNRNPVYCKMVDKALAKDYVANIIGEKYIVKTYGVWDSFEEIDFSVLPKRFVLKCNHDCKSTVIIKDKEDIDIDFLKRKFEKRLKINYFRYAREWPYKNVKPRIIAEELLENASDEPIVEYKWYCFNGDPKIVERIYNEPLSEERIIDAYNSKWELLDFQEIPRNNSGKSFDAPELLGEMIEKSRALSSGIPMLRVDFYVSNKELFFGELTLFESGGFFKVNPDTWDKKMGEWIKIANLDMGGDKIR